MANQYVNKVIIGKEVKLDLTADSVTPDKLAKGITAHDKTGAPITGTNTKDVDSSDATAAVAEIYDETPAIYTLKNFALETVEGTDMTYAEYVGAHSSEWTNIMTNLGFYWADNSAAPTEPDWDNLDWSVLTQAAGE